MFSRKKEITRIQKNPILGQVLSAIKDLKSQQAILESTANNKYPNSLEAQKYKLIVTFLTSIDQSIANYNRSKDDQLRSTGLLLVDIWVALSQLQPQDFEILAAQRNNNRTNTNKVINYTLVGGSTAIGLTTGGPVVSVGAAIISSLGSYLLRQTIGLNEPTTYTMKLFINLFKHTDEILGDIYRRYGYDNLNFNYEFIDISKPDFTEMLPNSIAVFLNNGSIAYALKDNNDKIITTKLDNYLDKQKLLDKESNRNTYKDIDQLIFEDYLQDDTERNNTLDIRLNMLTEEQKTIIIGAILKSFLANSSERLMPTFSLNL